MDIPTYQQPIKDNARRVVLERAVMALTKERDQSAIVVSHEFDEALNYGIHILDKHNLIDSKFQQEISVHLADWHAFHEAEVGAKKPSELRVLYLCGPEPQNDLVVLLSLGVIPQNIWAIESNPSIYGNAVNQLKDYNAYIRIHHGSLETFFDSTNEQFDIIYIDACAALLSGRTNTVLSPLLMFHRERLSSIGVLITNFSQPPDEKKAEYEKLLCSYFAPRYCDCPSALISAGVDPAIGSLEPEYLLPYIRANFDDVYSDFVTRFLVDLGREIVPYTRIYDNKDLREKYFSKGLQFKEAIERAIQAPPEILVNETVDKYFVRFCFETGDVLLNTASYPILSFFRAIRNDQSLAKLIQPLLSHKLRSETIDKSFVNTSILSQIDEGHWGVASEEMQLALAQSWLDADGGVFCDVPLSNLLINSLLGIYSHPYFPNPRQSLRFSYTAKNTKMYTDVFVFDQCRYYFGYLPTLDLIPQRFQSLPYQMVLRACLDRIGRYDFSSSAHPFSGSALAGFGEYPSANSYDFSVRSVIQS
jgi:hypothetical protein